MALFEGINLFTEVVTPDFFQKVHGNNTFQKRFVFVTSDSVVGRKIGNVFRNSFHYCLVNRYML